ncbi:MAG: four helix bundle protein [Bacteroidales bacterium]|nr:four helix bundle protein [Bacteroidales bacterium]
MAKFKKFEEIEAWKKTRTLCRHIYKESNEASFQKEYTLMNQLKRSSGSIMDNIAEGFERGGNKEFIHFLFISKGSAAETKSQLYRALDQNLLTNERFNSLYDLANEISYMIGKLIHYLKESDFKGIKFKTTQNTEHKTQNL